jgi:hypothetical protein
MPLLCIDGEIPDSDLRAWGAGSLSARVQLTRAEVRAVLTGPCLARGLALQALTPAQLVKLFPSAARRKNARKLRTWVARLSGDRVRVALAGATWHQLRAAAQHADEEAQIGAALAFEVIRRLS